MAKNPRIDRDWREPIRKSEVSTDFGLSLARVQWDAFATLTFAGNVPRTQIAYGLAWRWLQDTAKICRVPYKRLLIALRGEVGEETGRFHFHCLVGGTATRNYHTLTHQLEHLWKVSTGGARVEVRQYDRALAGGIRLQMPRGKSIRAEQIQLCQLREAFRLSDPPDNGH